MSDPGASVPRVARAEYVQETLAGLDPTAGAGVDPALPLYATTFVVVDLETTGGAPDGGGITEIGAVKVRGGEELGVLATLVNPGVPIPPFITVLTGITQAMLRARRRRSSRCCRASWSSSPTRCWSPTTRPYDVGFLKAACAKHGYRWPNPRVLDTAALARRVLTRDEVPNRKLGTLAAYFRTATQPTHRALDDARATVDVLHGLIGRLGGHRVDTLGDAIEFARAVTPTQRRKRHLADGLPKVPGVYIFRAADDRPLYVGTSGDIATRVRSYFTAGEKRARISEMLAAAERVEAVECAHSLEAEVRELRLIAAHAPPYNRRSKYPGADGLAEADRRGRTPGCRWCATSRPRTTAYLGPFALPAGRGAGRRRLPRRGAAAPVHAPAVAAHDHAGLRAGRAGPLPGALRAPDHPRGVRRHAPPRRSAPRPPATRRWWWTRCSPGSRCSPRDQRYEEAAVVRSRLAAVLRATRADAAAGRVDRDRRAGRRPAGRAAAAGSWRWSGTAGWPAPGCPRRVSTRDRRWSAIRATAETVLPGHGPVPRGHRRGDRTDPVLVGATGDPAGGDLLRLGVAGRPARAGSATCWPRRRTAASHQLSTERS